MTVVGRTKKSSILRLRQRSWNLKLAASHVDANLRIQNKQKGRCQKFYLLRSDGAKLCGVEMEVAAILSSKIKRMVVNREHSVLAWYQASLEIEARTAIE